MAMKSQPSDGDQAIAEMREFASFPARTQRYIRRSLDVGFDREDAVALWSRDMVEAAAIRVQQRVYATLHDLRGIIPDDSSIDSIGNFMGPLVAVSTFDLMQDRISDFSAYRFLYERLLGAAVRPWLPGAFCAASALPHLHPERRRQLLSSLGDNAATAPGWSMREPAFFPRWVEKVDEEKPAT